VSFGAHKVLFKFGGAKMDGADCDLARRRETVKRMAAIRRSTIRKMFGAVVFGAMAFGLCAARSAAQDKPATDASTATKVAAINMRAAIANTAEGKQAAAQLQTEFMARRKELEDLNKQISDIQQRLNASAGMLSDDEKERLTYQAQQLSRQLQHKQNDFQEDLNDAQSDVIARISRRIVDLLGKYAPSNGYGAVLDDSSQTTPVMYASTDITEAIVRLYDQTYPVKSGAGAGGAKPAGKTSGNGSGQ
jgi:Skp family chaperone for outer membrane proteins